MSQADFFMLHGEARTATREHYRGTWGFLTSSRRVITEQWRRPRSDGSGMFDPDVVEICAHCLAGAAVHEGGEADLALSATALARDLADTHRFHATALLGVAAREAVRHLDASELGAVAFAAALRRLSSLRARVEATLAGHPASVRPLAA